MGIEPTTSAWKAEVLPLNYTRINMGRLVGIEPTDVGATIRCVNHFAIAAILWLFNLATNKWWLGTESNRRHKDFQSFALPTELPSQNIVINLNEIFNNVINSFVPSSTCIFKDVGCVGTTRRYFDEVMLVALPTELPSHRI